MTGLMFDAARLLDLDPATLHPRRARPLPTSMARPLSVRGIIFDAPRRSRPHNPALWAAHAPSVHGLVFDTGR